MPLGQLPARRKFIGRSGNGLPASHTDLNEVAVCNIGLREYECRRRALSAVRSRNECNSAIAMLLVAMSWQRRVTSNADVLTLFYTDSNQSTSSMLLEAPSLSSC